MGCGICEIKTDMFFSIIAPENRTRGASESKLSTQFYDRIQYLGFPYPQCFFVYFIIWKGLCFPRKY